MEHMRAAACALAAAAAFACAACGASSDASTGARPTALDVALAQNGELSVAPAATSVKAGATTFVVHNGGRAQHELVVVPLGAGADPTSLLHGDEADETGSLGEASDIAPGQTKSVTIKLPAGTYALICNQPGHFAGGMRATLTVS